MAEIMVNILILAADSNSDQKDSNYPTFLSEIKGKTLLEHWADQANSIGGKIILAVSEEESKKWHLRETMKQLELPLRLFELKRPTQGATCTALLALAEVNGNLPLLILNGNEFLDVEFIQILEDFKAKSADAGLVFFDSLHPRYSYAKLNEKGFVEETAEKIPISRNATAGFYWYRESNHFFEGAERQLLKRLDSDGKYFICPIFNELILLGKKVASFEISNSRFIPMKSDRQIQQALKLKRG